MKYPSAINNKKKTEAGNSNNDNKKDKESLVQNESLNTSNLEKQERVDVDPNKEIHSLRYDTDVLYSFVACVALTECLHLFASLLYQKNNNICACSTTAE